MISIIFLLTTTLLAQGLSSPSVGVDSNGDARIIGGNEAKPRTNLHQVSLRKNGRTFCGGAIIDKYNVVTATHCILGLLAKDVLVVVGTDELIKGGVAHAVSNLVSHEDYNNKTQVADVALLHLKVPIAFSKTAQKIELQKMQVGSGTSCKVTGWGLLGLHENAWQPNALQELLVTIMSLLNCKTAYKDYNKPNAKAISDGHVCTETKGTTPKGVCHGDSGGPLVCNGKLVGIVSWALECGLNHPVVYAKISFFADWINKNKKV